MAGTWRLALGLASVLAVLTCASRTSAQLRVELSGCAGLSGLELASAVELELGAGPSGSLVVRAMCDEAGLLIEVEDPVTDKRLVRRVPEIDVSRPGIARAVALLVSELVLASWAELLLRREVTGSPERESALARVEAEMGAERAASGTVLAEDGAAAADGAAAEGEGGDGPAETEASPSTGVASEARATEATGAPTSTDPAAAETDVAATTQPRQATPLLLDLDGGVRVRDLAAPFAGPLLGIRGMVRLTDGVALGARVTLELSDVARGAGSISLAVVGAGLVLGIEAVRVEAFVLDVSLEVRGAWIRLDGRPARSSVEGRAVDAALLDFELLVAPGFELGSFHGALGLAIGATALGPTGTISGEPDLTLPGVFLGVSLLLGLR